MTTVPPPPDTTPDGLVRRPIRGVELAYVRPGADFRRYTSLLLDPVRVEFDHDWKGASVEERERVRKEAADLFASVFRQALEQGDGYRVVNVPGPGVLRVSASLVDVYVNAPRAAAQGQSYRYVMDAGRVTLEAELADSTTGEILARVTDKQYGRDEGDLKWSNSILDAAAARTIFDGWARLLRERLDAVHAESTT